MAVMILLFLILGAVCLIASAFNVSARQVNLLSLGLFFWILVPLVSALSKI